MARRFQGSLVALLWLLALPGMAAAAGTEQRLTELASTPPAGTSDAAVCESHHHDICPRFAVTRDGRRVYFMFGHDGPLLEHSGGQTTPVSVGPLGIGQGPGNCYSYAGPSYCNYEVSSDGRTVAFMTLSSLVPEDTGGWDVYVRSRGVTRLVSTERPEVDHSYSAFLVGMSDDGSRVFYRAANYYEGSPLYEWNAGRVSKFPSDAAPVEDAYVFEQGASRDGRRIFFGTAAALVPADQNREPDLYERTFDGRIELISAGAAGAAGSGWLDAASSDGRRAIFDTTASLVPEDTDSEGDIYEREGGTTTLLTPDTSSSMAPPFPDGEVPWRAVYFLAASTDGSRVFFESDEPLVPNDADGGAIDVYERSDGRTKLVSTSALDPNARVDARFAYPGGISADGTHVFFTTDEKLVPEDTDSCVVYTDEPPGCPDLYERVGDTTRLVTTGPTAANGNYRSGDFLGVSSDGTRVLFETDEPLVAGDRDTCNPLYGPSGCSDIYERHNGTTSLVSTGPTDDQGDCESGDVPRCAGFVGMSSDGERVYFTTSQSLVPGDTDGGLRDIYLSRVLHPGCTPKKHGATPKKC